MHEFVADCFCSYCHDIDILVGLNVKCLYIIWWFKFAVYCVVMSTSLHYRIMFEWARAFNLGLNSED